jgi:hypothetical protein
MSFRAPAREKWHPTANLAGQTPREAAAVRERKVWQTRALQSGAVGSEHGEMALWALEKAPFCAIFHHFFVDFPRVFSASLPMMAQSGANATSKCCGRFLVSSLPAFLISFERGTCPRAQQIRQCAQSENVNPTPSFLRPRQADSSLSGVTARRSRAQKLQETAIGCNRLPLWRGSTARTGTGPTTGMSFKRRSRAVFGGET